MWDELCRGTGKVRGGRTRRLAASVFIGQAAVERPKPQPTPAPLPPPPFPPHPPNPTVQVLIGKDGQVVKRYAPTATPESLTGDIEAALSA